MKKILQRNLSFLIPYLLFLLIAGIFLSVYSKAEAHLIINRFSYVSCDYFFYYTTFLGDGITAVVLVILLCFVQFRYAVFVALSNIISSGITQLLKRTVFADVDRPVRFFEGGASLKLVPWAENYINNSFPSGHATVAFTTFFCFALILENRALKFLMFLVALAIGFSRVYLSQHFLDDVYAGSLIGVVISLLVYYFMQKTKDISWMDRSILKYK